MQKEMNHNKAVREKLEKWLEVGEKVQAKYTAEQLEAETVTEENPTEKFLNLHVLAKYYRMLKNYDLAVNYSQQAIRLAKQLNKDQVEVIIAVYLNYVSLEREYGQLSNGRIQIANLLALLDKHKFQDHYSFGLIYKSLGAIELDMENIENGLKQLEKSLFHFQKSVPANHPMIVKTINQLAEVYVEIEDYHKALKHHLYLLKVYQSEEDPIKEGRQLLTLGDIYFYVDLRKARQIITEAIPLLKQANGGQHPDIAKAYFMLAEIDEHMYRLPRAVTYYKRALEQIKQTFSEEHFLAVYAYSKLGTISIKVNKWTEAKDYLERGLSYAKKYPKIRLQFLYALGKLYSGEKEYGQALTVFQEFLKQLEQSGKTYSLAYGNTLQAIAFNELQQENIETACSYYERAWFVYEKVPNCNEEKGLTLIRLSYCYENREDKDLLKSETYLERGYKLLEGTPNKELLEETLVEIIEFFTGRNNLKKRKKYEEQLIKLKASGL